MVACTSLEATVLPEGTPAGTAGDKHQHDQEYDQAGRENSERREYNRRYAQEQRQKAKELGKCRDCSSSAILGQTRCESCAENHRQSRRRSDARRRAAAKEELAKASIGSTDRASQPGGNGV